MWRAKVRPRVKGTYGSVLLTHSSCNMMFMRPITCDVDMHIVVLSDYRHIVILSSREMSKTL
jgi:hypothetical protein